MLRKLRALGSRIFRRGYRFSDLILGVIGQPRLAWAAFRHVTRRRARIVEGNLKLAENRNTPVPAASVCLSREELIGALAQRFGLFLLSEEADRVRLGVAETDLLSVLHWLARSVRSPKISISGKNLTFASTDFKTLALSAGEVNLSYVTPHLTNDLFVIEPYFRHGPSKWISPTTEAPTCPFMTSVIRSRTRIFI